MSARWFCETHRAWTSTDCPTCDDEQITGLEKKYAKTDQSTYGMCTACGAIEVALNAVTGTRDFSAIGEHAEYPTGYGCEACS